MKKFVLFTLVVLTFLTASASFAAPLTVAVNPDSVPFKYIDANGDFRGIDPDIIRAVAEAEGLEIKFIRQDFDLILKNVESCDVDLAISGISYTDERAAKMLMSDPYLTSGQAIYTIDGSGIESIADVKHLGAKEGATGVTHAERLQLENDFEIDTFAGYQELINALIDGEVDAIIGDTIQVDYAIGGHQSIVKIGEPVSEEQYVIAVCPKNTELLAQINDGLKQIEENGKLDAILNQYK